jgi:hypothetical protein
MEYNKQHLGNIVSFMQQNSTPTSPPSISPTFQNPEEEGNQLSEKIGQLKMEAEDGKSLILSIVLKLGILCL